MLSYFFFPSFFVPFVLFPPFPSSFPFFLEGNGLHWLEIWVGILYVEQGVLWLQNFHSQTKVVLVEEGCGHIQEMLWDSRVWIMGVYTANAPDLNAYLLI